MTSADLVVLFRDLGLPGFVLPGLVAALCLFGGVVVALGLRRHRETGLFPGAFFVLAGLYLGDQHTALALPVLGAVVFAGFGCGLLATAGRIPARAQPSRQRRLE